MDNKLKDSTKSFLNFLQTMKKYETLKINMKRLSCFDVNLNVIEKFECCNKIDKLDLFPDEIKKYIEENKIENTISKESCIDILGVYIQPKENEKANILLSKEKIKKVSINYNIESEVLYDFVKTHEYAHAAMWTKLSDNCSNEDKNDLYIFIEESLATAVSLKKFKKHQDYSILEKFVKNQLPQYSYGLVLIEQYEENIEKLMELWKIVKNQLNKEVKVNQNLINNMFIPFIEMMYKYSNDERLLPKDAKDIFIF